MQATREIKRSWFDLLLQHAVPEDVARFCIRDAANEAQLTAKIEALVPSAKSAKLLLVLSSFPGLQHKQQWLRVFMRYGLPTADSITFLRNIEGGASEIERGLHSLHKFPRNLAKTLVAEVCVRRLCHAYAAVTV